MERITPSSRRRNRNSQPHSSTEKRRQNAPLKVQSKCQNAPFCARKSNSSQADSAACLFSRPSLKKALWDFERRLGCLARAYLIDSRISVSKCLGCRSLQRTTLRNPMKVESLLSEIGGGWAADSHPPGKPGYSTRPSTTENQPRRSVQVMLGWKPALASMASAWPGLYL
jgi:hypothetical protein